jgi:hypothetical protein
LSVSAVFPALKRLTHPILCQISAVPAACFHSRTTLHHPRITQSPAISFVLGGLERSSRVFGR